MMSVLNRIDWKRASPSLMVGLTYPDPLADVSAEQRNKDRYLFLRYVEKYLKRKICTVYRTEWVPRQTGQHVDFLVPHFHFLVLNVRYLHMDLVNEWWKKTLGWDTYVNTDVRRLKGKDAGLRYVAKQLSYVAKKRSLGIETYLNNWSTVGRAWGITRRNLVPWARARSVIELTESQLALIRQRIGEKLPYYDPDRGGGARVFGRDAILDIIRDLGIDESDWL